VASTQRYYARSGAVNRRGGPSLQPAGLKGSARSEGRPPDRGGARRARSHRFGLQHTDL